MSNLIDLIGSGGPAVIIITVLIVGVFFVALFKYLKGMRGTESLPKKQAGHVLQQLVAERQEPEPGEVPATNRSKLGPHGVYKCLAFRPGQIADYTGITESMGLIKLADKSCPLSGDLYLVLELPSGEVVDYEPRLIPVDVDKHPMFAWICTHWRQHMGFWIDEVEWWKSKDIWFAIGMMVIMGLAALVTLD